MHLISNKALRDFSARHPESNNPLQAWRKIIERSTPRSFADLKQLWNSTDKAGSFYVFNVGGNKYRVIAAVHFDRQMLYVRHVFTHPEYDDWRP
jgi:mRNA interferase HigB